MCGRITIPKRTAGVKLMRICILAPEFIPVWGGAGTYTQELVRHLPREYEIHVVTPRRKRIGSDTIDVSQKELELGDNIHVHYVSNATDTFVYNGEFQYACLRHVPRILKEEQIEVIQSHMSHMPDLLLRLRRRKVPTVVTLHSTIRIQRLAVRLSSQPFGALERSEQLVCTLYPVLSWAEKLFLNGTNLCIAPSRWIKGEALRLSSISKERANAVRVIPNSIDFKECKIAAERGRDRVAGHVANRRMLLYCGRFLANKGLGVLVEAVPKILQSFKDSIIFVFAGPGDSSVYRDKLLSLGVPSSNFLFMAPVSRLAILELMGRAEALILPSFLENCPYSVLEAMACELPVIAANVGGIPEIIQDCESGLTFSSGSPSELAQKTIQLLQNEGLRRKVTRNARQVVANRFSWVSNLRMQMSAYESVLS